MLFPVFLLGNVLDANWGMRNKGLNSAYSALVNNSESILVNPSALGFINKPELSFERFSHYNNIPVYNASFVLPFSTKPNYKKTLLERISIGFNVLTGGLKGITIYDKVGQEISSIDYSFFNLKIAGGINVVHLKYLDLAPGIGISFYKDTINDETLKKQYLDYSFLSIIHFGSGFFYNFFGHQLRTALVLSQDSQKLGFAVKLFEKLFLDVDIKYRDWNYNSTHIGIEKWFWRRLGLRTGIGIGDFSDKWTAGLSFALVRHKQKRFYIEASKILIGDLNDSFSVGIKYRW